MYIFVALVTCVLLYTLYVSVLRIPAQIEGHMKQTLVILTPYSSRVDLDLITSTSYIALSIACVLLSIKTAEQREE